MVTSILLTDYYLWDYFNMVLLIYEHIYFHSPLFCMVMTLHAHQVFIIAHQTIRQYLLSSHDVISYAT